MKLADNIERLQERASEGLSQSKALLNLANQTPDLDSSIELIDRSSEVRETSAELISAVNHLRGVSPE